MKSLNSTIKRVLQRNRYEHHLDSGFNNRSNLKCYTYEKQQNTNLGVSCFLRFLLTACCFVEFQGFSRKEKKRKEKEELKEKFFILNVCRYIFVVTPLVYSRLNLIATKMYTFPIKSC